MPSGIAQVNDLYLSTIETLAMAVDAKDQITHGHIRRVQVFAVELARLLGVREGGQLRRSKLQRYCTTWVSWPFRAHPQ